MSSDQLSVRAGSASFAWPALAVNSRGQWRALMDKENGAGVTERRQASRIRVVLPVDVMLPEQPEQSETRRGITRDVSASGMFYETEHVLPFGEQIRVVLLFKQGLPEVPLRVLCEGRVVRVEPREGKAGVAVAFTSYRFEPED